MYLHTNIYAKRIPQIIMFSNSSITNIDYTTMSYIRTGLKYTNTDTIFSKYLFKIFTGKNIK